jgi:hypothetical protein
VLDAVPVLAYVAGAPKAQSCIDTRADVDCDHAISARDVLHILLHQAGVPLGTATDCPGPGGAVLPEPLPSSFDLIDAAVEAGEIDEGTGLTYKILSVYEDPRSPSQYDVPGQPQGVELADDLIATYPSLTPQQRQDIAPFLLPPSAPGSWVELQASAGSTSQPAGNPPNLPEVEWQTISAADGHIKVWWQVRYPDTQALAEVVAEAIGPAYDSLTTYMGRAPLGDASLANSGGDGALDMYIVDMDDAVLGLTDPYDPEMLTANPCPAYPSFIQLNRTLSLARAPSIATHELFHAIHDAFPSQDDCQKAHWIHEAGATWAEDYVFPDDNTEHVRKFQFDYPQTQLLERENDEYGGYIFLFFLTHEYEENLVRKIFEALANSSTADAIGSQTQGWETVWPLFGLYLLNEPPFDQFSQWDGIPYHARTRDLNSTYTYGDPEVRMSGQSVQEYEADRSRMTGPANQYIRFKFPDPEAALITLRNPYGNSQPDDVKVQVILKVAGEEPRMEVVDPGESLTFCRNIPDQNLEEVIFNVSAYMPGEIAGEFSETLLTAGNSCGYVGSIHGNGVELRYRNPTTNMYRDVEATNLILVASEPPGPIFGQDWDTLYKVVSGTLVFRWTGTARGGYGIDPPQACTVDETMTVDIAGNYIGGIAVRQGADGVEYRGWLTAAPGVPSFVSAFKHCPISGDLPLYLNSGTGWYLDANQTAPDSSLLEGSAVVGVTDEYEGYSYEWSFTNADPP